MQNRRITLASLASLILPLAVPPLWAQTSPTSEPEANSEQVVVTARKRDETNQDVPISVNVFNEQSIESAGIQKPQDFISLVPNMTLVETQNAGHAFVVIRGISQ